MEFVPSRPALPGKNRLVVFERSLDQRAIAGVEVLFEFLRIPETEGGLGRMKIANGQTEEPAGLGQKRVARVQRPSTHVLLIRNRDG